MKRTAGTLAALEEFYSDKKRVMPWRQPDPDGSFDPYKILVSEFMLQQTQVSRVIPKYHAFLAVFPTIQALAEAPFSEVVAQWVGLGYNRRARYLWESAKRLADKPQPWTRDDLVACPGIGPNTAVAILVYSYDLPVVFVETNIRTVIIYHYFAGRQAIADKAILAKLEDVMHETLKTHSPREFYWAMMDYGAHLKATVGNLNRHSKAYAKQSRFEGSRRQIRGRLVSLLMQGPVGINDVRQRIDDPRLDDVIDSLVREKLISFQDNALMLYNGSESR